MIAFLLFWSSPESSWADRRRVDTTEAISHANGIVGLALGEPANQTRSRVRYEAS